MHEEVIFPLGLGVSFGLSGYECWLFVFLWKFGGALSGGVRGKKKKIKQTKSHPHSVHTSCGFLMEPDLDDGMSVHILQVWDCRAPCDPLPHKS